MRCVCWAPGKSPEQIREGPPSSGVGSALLIQSELVPSLTCGRGPVWLQASVEMRIHENIRYVWQCININTDIWQYVKKYVQSRRNWYLHLCTFNHKANTRPCGVKKSCLGCWEKGNCPLLTLLQSASLQIYRNHMDTIICTIRI